MAELREDIAVMGMRYGLLDEFILERYGAAIGPLYCHLCGKCEATCPKGVSISIINRCTMYAEAYKSLELARSTYGELPSHLSATTCLDCSACVAKCANGLDIPVKMGRARKLLA